MKRLVYLKHLSIYESLVAECRVPKYKKYRKI